MTIVSLSEVQAAAEELDLTADQLLDLELADGGELADDEWDYQWDFS